MAIDIMFAVAVVVGFYMGFARGIIKTVFGIIALLFGLMAAFKFAPATTKFLETSFASNNPLMFLAGFLISFVVTMFLIRLFARGLEGALKTANINVINQLAGGTLFAGIMVIVFSTLLWFGEQAHMVNDEVRTTSKTYPYLQKIPGQTQVVFAKIQPVFQDFWDQSMDMMDRLEDLSIEKTENNNVFDIEDDEPTAEDSTN